MKVLVVTAKLAEETVKQHLHGCDNVEVVVLDAPVAALLTPKQIARELKGRRLQGFSIILTPGLMAGDVSTVEEAVGLPVRKGPRYAADLPWVIEALDHAMLSKTVPADDVLKAELQARAARDLSSIEAEYARMPMGEGVIRVGKLLLGRGLPSRVMAEIIDVPLLSDEKIRRRARYYINSGADIVDLGMQAGESRPRDAARAVRAVRSISDCPISIDTLNVAEIEAAVEEGVDLILSVDGGNLADVAKLASDVAAVLIPADHVQGRFPKKPMERVAFLQTLLAKARALGMRHLIADLILDVPCSPGIVPSLAAYAAFAEMNPTVPLLFGVGNVTELMDADSVGVNALLAAISAELGGGILLTTENSDKTRGCVRELATASKMMALARRRGSAPKDLGLSLLRYHEKKAKEELYDPRGEDAVKVIETDGTQGFQMDPKGYFRVQLDRESGQLVAAHFRPGETASADVILKAKRAEALYKAIVDQGLLSTLDHAAYLGLELGKAELALKTGRSYVQDAPLFE
ncbi:MAG: dihydropteroate synthase-like protein [Candidatus Bathyarchaeia archaeon]